MLNKNSVLVYFFRMTITLVRKYKLQASLLLNWNHIIEIFPSSHIIFYYSVHHTEILLLILFFLDPTFPNEGSASK